jgi:IS5 family transposase
VKRCAELAAARVSDDWEERDAQRRAHQRLQEKRNLDSSIDWRHGL